MGFRKQDNQNRRQAKGIPKRMQKSCPAKRERERKADRENPLFSNFGLKSKSKLKSYTR